MNSQKPSGAIIAMHTQSNSTLLSQKWQLSSISLIILQHIMRPSIVHTGEQVDLRSSTQTYHPISHTKPSSYSCSSKFASHYLSHQK